MNVFKSTFDNLKSYVTTHKVTAGLIGALLIVFIGGFFFFQNSQSQTAGPVEEIDLTFDAEGPYALLYPRKDGNALVLKLLRTSSYDEISYELAYTSKADETIVTGTKISEEEGEAPDVIDRGVVGNIDTQDKRGEYEQEILFGSCSKNVCKYDQGVENGTLTLRIRKGNKAYRIITQWHLQKPDVALGVLTSGDEHFTYKMKDDRSVLANVGFSIVNDLIGVPKLPSGKEVLGKVYALNVPISKTLPTGEITIEMAENVPADAKVYRYDESKSEWQELASKADGSKLTTAANGAGIFAVLTSK